MMKFVVWILAKDKALAEKWYRLFSREHFDVVVLPDLQGLDGASQYAWGILFAEISTDCLPTAKCMSPLISGRKNLSCIVFSRPEKTTNSIISEFLESGADDFITSDIDERILLSKTKAHIRRLLPSINLAKTVVVSRNGTIEIDRTKRTVVLNRKAGAEKTLDNLTPKEFEIFYMLLGSEEAVVSRENLMEEIWKDKAGKVNTETIDKHVETLRHKLGTYGKNIRTVYGSGYTYKAE
jgi:DNA-binding response OmpR family regulator